MGKWHDLWENAPVMLYSVDRDGRLRCPNSTTCKTLKYAREDLDGMHIWDIFHPQFRKKSRALFARFFRIGRTGGVQMKLLTGEGTSQWVMHMANFIRDRTGSVSASRSVLVPIDDRTVTDQELGAFSPDIWTPIQWSLNKLHRTSNELRLRVIRWQRFTPPPPWEPVCLRARMPRFPE